MTALVSRWFYDAVFHFRIFSIVKLMWGSSFHLRNPNYFHVNIMYHNYCYHSQSISPLCLTNNTVIGWSKIKYGCWGKERGKSYHEVRNLDFKFLSLAHTHTHTHTPFCIIANFTHKVRYGYLKLLYTVITKFKYLGTTLIN